MADGSVTCWIGQLKGGGASIAEQQLWDHYFARLTALARAKLLDLPPHLRDDEDVVLSALNTFFTRARQDGFSRLQDRTDLWQLLAKITVRKTINRRQHARSRKRSCGRVNAELTTELHNIAANEPTPDMLVAFNEQWQRLLGGLRPDLRTVARMKLEGYTNREIAAVLGRVERTVERKLDRIRSAWLVEADSS